MCCFDEEETVTTTTITKGTEGDLKRQREGKQFFVIDPADEEKIYVNDNDDMYEDASGNHWRLV